MKKIELLSPARNLECGIEAVKHGADAVYIGAPKFGARSAAGNSLQDIEKLAAYAHRFNARVYAALNTILTDSELDDTQSLIWDLYRAGADAIIVQDMGILQLDLPPVALHASTQTDNRSLEKVQFLEKAGFSQIVLARELGLEQIKNIASQVNVPLEVFVHGALCVSYSGQCYVSEALGGRSANRGECAQCCRLPYDLVDGYGNTLLKNKYLLSLKDLNLSDFLEELLNAGLSSFKIEGRLKDAAYVKNVTAFYRQRLDEIFERGLQGKPAMTKASSGKITYFFQPDVQKTFHRGSTGYFLHGRNAEITSFDTPKSTGEFVGTVRSLTDKYIILNCFAAARNDETNKKSTVIASDSEAIQKKNITFHNGDGLCFTDKNGNFGGFRINKAENNRLYFGKFDISTGSMPNIGTKIFRNLDYEFLKLLEKDTAERKIAVDFSLSETPNGFSIKATDEDNNEVSLSFETKKEKAQNAEKTAENIKMQFSKLGNTDFYLKNILLYCHCRLDPQSPEKSFFIPNSLLTEWRRKIIEKLAEKRTESYVFTGKKIEKTTHPYPARELTYLGNVHNQKAAEFYRQHGDGYCTVI